MSAPAPSPSAIAEMRSDADYREFEQFQQFKALLKLTGPLAAPPPPLNRSGSEHPPNLANPTYLQAERVAGFLGKQFPTIGNPAPLGLCGFALTTFVLSMFNVGATVNTSGPQGVVMGLALFYGGMIQLLAGMWELRVGNTFGATAFASYGGFWMSLAALHIKAFGFMDAYAGQSHSYINNAMGIYLFSWCIFSVLMTIASHRTTVVLFTLFATVAMTFLMLAIGHWADSVNCNQAGGAFGLLAAALAWYAALAGLLTKNNSHFTLPVWPLHPEDAAADAAAVTSDIQLSKV